MTEFFYVIGICTTVLLGIVGIALLIDFGVYLVSLKSLASRIDTLERNTSYLLQRQIDQPTLAKIDHMDAKINALADIVNKDKE